MEFAVRSKTQDLHSRDHVRQNARHRHRDVPRMRKLLIANRGEIAIRIAQSAAELGVGAVAVFSEDDAESLHTRKADEARPLRGTGPAAYLDIEQMIGVARETGCDA